MRRSPGQARWASAADLPLPALLAAGLLLGGSSYGGAVPNALVQLAGIAALAWIGVDPARRARARTGRLLGAILLGWLGWAAITLVPVPADGWRWGEGRAGIARNYALLGMVPPTRPLSLDPDRTVAAMLSTIPFLAALALGLDASARARRHAAALVLGVALASVLLGAFQLLGDGRWYPYRPANVGATVGLFANADHLATLLLMALPLAAALAGRADCGARWTLLAAIVVLLGGLAVDGSVAGWLLAVPATAGGVLVYRRAAERAVAARVAARAGAVLAAIATVLILGPLRAPIVAGADVAARATILRRTLAATRDFLPLGAGPGTFREVYPRYEDAGAVTLEFVVHAHDDYLELALEMGWAGVALIAAGLAWAGARSAAAWRRGVPAGSLAPAASVALAMPLLHGLVDFPARTAAIAGLAGFAASLLEAPVSRRH